MHDPTPDWRDEHTAEARWQGMHTAARHGEVKSWAEVQQAEADYKHWRAANLFGALGCDRHLWIKDLNARGPLLPGELIDGGTCGAAADRL